jgi:hypothetical protein
MRLLRQVLFGVLAATLGAICTAIYFSYPEFETNINRAIYSLSGALAYLGFGACCAVALFCGYVLALELFNIGAGSKVRHAFLERVRKRFEDRAQIGLLAVAAATALFAFNFYRDQTAFSLLQALEERDRASRAVYMTGGTWPEKLTERATLPLAKTGPPFVTSALPSPSRWEGKDLIRIYAGSPQRRDANGNAVDLTDDDYKSCDPTVRTKIKTWAVRYFKDASGYDPKNWEDIPALYKKVWNADEVLEPRSEFSRALVMHAVDYLYIVHDGVVARNRGYFSNDQYMMWGAYLDDLTPSPFFLLAMADADEYPYMMKEVRDEFRSYYLRADKQRLHCIVNTLYPTFLKPVLEASK